MNGAECIVEIIQAMGIGHVFGIPGGPILPVYDAFSKASGTRHVLVRHEMSAAFMADAYSKASGGLGVCISTTGPGALNLATGIATAYSDSTPILALTGQAPLAMHGTGFQQEIDPCSVFKSITKWSEQIRQSQTLPQKVERAIRLCLTPRTGPVHLDLPRDIQTSEVSSAQGLKPLRIHHPRPLDIEAVEEAFRRLTAATSPLILAGGGVVLSNAFEELRKFAEAADIPVATSFNGKGALPEDHGLSLGRIGEFTSKTICSIASEADLLLALGYRFTDVALEQWTPRADAEVIQVDIDPSELQRSRFASLRVVGDVRKVLQDLAKRLRENPSALPDRSGWLSEVRKRKEDWTQIRDAQAASESKPINPRRFIKALRNVLKRDAVVTAEAGRAKMWMATLFPIYAPRTWIHSGGFAPMGYALPAAIAAKLAQPNRQVVAVCGDGAFQMVASELATAKENGVNITACIIDDSQLGIIHYAQRKRYGGRIYATEFTENPSFQKLAEAYGAEGIFIDDPEDIEPTLRHAVSQDNLTVIDVKVDPTEDPVFP